MLNLWYSLSFLFGRGVNLTISHLYFSGNLLLVNAKRSLDKDLESKLKIK